MEKYIIKIADEEVDLDSPEFWKRLESSPRRIFGNIQPWKELKTTC